MRHLADALGRRPDLTLRLWAPPGDRHPAVMDATVAAEAVWLARLMHAGGIAHLYRQGGVRGPLEVMRLLRYLSRAYRRKPSPQLYHVNWLQNALPLPADGRPLLVTVLGTDLQLLRLPLMKSMLRRVLRGRSALIAPNADWMVAPLRRWFGDLAEVRFLPFGIDPDWFALPRRAQARPRWLVISRLTTAKLGPLFDVAAPAFLDGSRELHLIGPMQERIEIPHWVHYHGPRGPEELKTTWFPEAAGLLTLSQHAEGRPQVILEAMAAGLPVIASNIPAHASFLSHGLTGWLHTTEASLDRALACMESPDGATQAAAARDWVRKEVGTWDDCAARYALAYRELLAVSP